MNLAGGREGRTLACRWDVSRTWAGGMSCADEKATGKAPSRNGFGSSRAANSDDATSSFGEEEVVSARLWCRVACLNRAGIRPRWRQCAE